MAVTLSPAENLVRVHGRGLFLSILERDCLLTRIKVFPDGHFATETKDWSSYWQPLSNLGCEEVEDSLNALYSAWCDYIQAGFSSLLRREFCFRYFSLLDILLSNCREASFSPSWVHALQTALGFECFGITPADSDLEVPAAGTSTLRNPCYLLAKLRMPEAPDDPQFLPIITVAGTEKPELFYHYRQYTLSPDSPMSLLLYPTVSEANRSASFRLINSLSSSVSYAIDPRTRERAQRLCRSIIHPIMQAHERDESRTLPLERIDVGAGSGSLASSLCRQIHRLGTSMGFNPKFRLWFVDLEPADPARFFRAKRFRGLVDNLAFLGDDYRDWLSRPQPLPATNGLRIAVILKLFNNLSCFSIRCLSREDLLPLLCKMAPSDLSACLPSRCLAPNGGGVELLVISNARLALPEGRTFAQLSLSECLVTSDGKSVISRLVENCDYVIIEDADLRPQDLIDHMTMFSLHSSAVQDMTKALGLIGNHAYVAWTKTKAAEPGFSGERIW